MDKQKLEQLIAAVASGELQSAQAVEQLKYLPFKDLGFARLDSHRMLRQGMPEVIFCPGKTSGQIVAIAENLHDQHDLILATKATAEMAVQVLELSAAARYQAISGTIYWGEFPACADSGLIVNLLTAGTADIAIAEEAAVFLKANGVEVQRFFDVGVAGIHRLLAVVEPLRKGAVTIVVAGMDGALPSVVAGLVEGPVIAVPTSVGYGASFEGLAALLTMLNSCAAGLTVVNIDNGFGAAVAALRILSLVSIPR